MRLEMSLWAEGMRIFVDVGIVHDSPDVCVDNGIFGYTVGEIGILFADTVGGAEGGYGQDTETFLQNRVNVGEAGAVSCSRKFVWRDD